MRIIILLLLSLLPAFGQLTNFQCFIDGEAGTAGNALTVALLNSGTHGSIGTWSISPADPSTKISVGTVGQMALRSNIRLNGTEYTAASDTRTYECLQNANGAYANLHLTATCPKISVGFYVRLTGFPNLGNSYDIFQLDGSGEYQVLNYDDSSGSGTRFRNHSNGTPNVAEVCQISMNTTYWVTMLWDKTLGSSGQVQMRVYDPSTWRQLGSNTLTMASRQNCADMRFGKPDAHSLDSGTSHKVYFDNFIVCTNAATFPVLPAGATVQASALTASAFSTAYASTADMQGTNRDVLLLPTGTQTFTTSGYNNINKSIVISGNGTNNTVITLNGTVEAPTLFNLYAPFCVVSNIYTKGTSETGTFVNVYSNQCRVAYNLLGNLYACVWARYFGLADHNTFYNSFRFGRVIFSEVQSEMLAYYPQAWDSTNFFFFEQNKGYITSAKSPTGALTAVSSQQSDFWVFRHNDMFMTNASCNYDSFLDFHGNDPGFTYPGLGWQVYSNRLWIGAGSVTGGFTDQRGTRALIYSNQVFGVDTSDGTRFREEVPANSPNWHVTATYAWENYDTDGVTPMRFYNLDPTYIVPDVDLFNSAPSTLLSPPFPHPLQGLPANSGGGTPTPPSTISFGGRIQGVRATR